MRTIDQSVNQSINQSIPHFCCLCLGFLTKRANHSRTSSSSDAEDALLCLSHVLVSLTPKWEVLQASTQFLSGPDAQIFGSLKIDESELALPLQNQHWSLETYQHWAHLLNEGVIMNSCMKCSSVAPLLAACSHLVSCLCEQVRCLKRSRIPVIEKLHHSSSADNCHLFGNESPESSNEGAVVPTSVSTGLTSANITTVEANEHSELSKLRTFREIQECLHSNQQYQVGTIFLVMRKLLDP
jgi:hypothetical protein